MGPSSTTSKLLQQRLIEFGVAACQALRRVPKDIVGTHVAKQLVRAVTSPAANYAEAQAAESYRDFVHKMQICLKELREADVWLRFMSQLGRGNTQDDRLARECGELIAIFVASVNTARTRNREKLTPSSARADPSGALPNRKSASG